MEWCGDIFSDFITVKITDNFAVVMGDAYVNGVLYAKPRDGYEYTFPNNTRSPRRAQRRKNGAGGANLETAHSEYGRASDKITALQQQIDDDNYSETETETETETADKDAAAKAIWTTYRKVLRAYIAADAGTAALPKAPTL